MVSSLYTGAWAFWLLAHKVVFDPELKLIRINAGVDAIDVQVDVYSAAKEWLLLEDNARNAPPLRSVGGDPLPGGVPLGRTFFLINGWRVLVDHAVVFTGNLYSEDFASPYITQDGVQLASEQRSNLVDVAQPTVDLSGLSTAIWQHMMATGQSAEQALLATLTTGKYVALKGR